MGKAIINSEQGAGEYTATVQYDTNRADQTVSDLTAKITELDSKITIQQAAMIDEQNAVDAVYHELDLAVFNGESLAKLAEITAKLQGPLNALNKERNILRQLKLDKLAAQKKKTFIENNLPTPQAITVWCADYSEGLTGEVGTIEVNGDLQNPPIIYPAGSAGTNAVHTPARDFQLQPIVSSGAPAVYFNRALLPGWQKWLPMYRVGTIQSISGDLCDLDLDEALSSQQALNINQSTSLSNVPIEYMTSNGGVFEIGDRVVVKFENQEWASPKVIGFESNPKPEEVIYLLNDVFGAGSAPVDIYKSNFDASQINLKVGFGNKQGDSRNLKRVGSDFYYYHRDSNTGDREIRKNTVVIAPDTDRLFCVNSQYLYTYDYDTNIYSKLIYRRDRNTGAVIDSFNCVIPGKTFSADDRPGGICCNETNFFFFAYADSYNEGIEYLVKCDLDGSNQTIVMQSPYPGTTDGGESWRGFHVTSDRIYFPEGDNYQNNDPIDCRVYDMDGNHLTSFGPLPYNALATYDYNGFAVDEKRAVWIEDTDVGGLFLHVWDRVLTYDQFGEIDSETFTKRTQTPVNISGLFDGIRGGISL